MRTFARGRCAPTNTADQALSQQSQPHRLSGEPRSAPVPDASAGATTTEECRKQWNNPGPAGEGGA